MIVIVIVIVVIFIIIVIFSILLGILVISFLILILFIFGSRSLLVPIFTSFSGSLLITSLEPLVKNEVGLVHLLSEHHPQRKESTGLQLALLLHVGMHVSLTLREFAVFLLLRVNAHPKL